MILHDMGSHEKVRVLCKGVTYLSTLNRIILAVFGKR